MEQDELIQTGVEGLDRILLGGITKGNMILIEGAPGTGKTLLGTAFIYRGAIDYDEPGIIVMFESNPSKLSRDAACFGWNLEELQNQNKLRIIFTSPQVLYQELRSPDSLLLETANEIGASRIFIDGISLLRTMTSGTAAANDDGANSYRELLHQLIQGLQRENLTAILSHEVIVRDQQSSALEVAEFLADTVIVLNRELAAYGIHRSLEIVKSRGQDYDHGRHTLTISHEGPKVFRRVQSRPRNETDQPSSAVRRSVIGVQALDSLIGGGIFDGSTTMVVGISGVGKTVLGTRFCSRAPSSMESAACSYLWTSIQCKSCGTPKRWASI